MYHIRLSYIKQFKKNIRNKSTKVRLKEGGNPLSDFNLKTKIYQEKQKEYKQRKKERKK